MTSNLSEKDDPACLFVGASTSNAQAAGLEQNCLICCTFLSSMSEDRLDEKVGKLSVELLTELDNCLMAALGIG